MVRNENADLCMQVMHDQPEKPQILAPQVFRTTPVDQAEIHRFWSDIAPPSMDTQFMRQKIWDLQIFWSRYICRVAWIFQKNTCFVEFMTRYPCRLFIFCLCLTFKCFGVFLVQISQVWGISGPHLTGLGILWAQIYLVWRYFAAKFDWFWGTLGSNFAVLGVILGEIYLVRGSYAAEFTRFVGYFGAKFPGCGVLWSHIYLWPQSTPNPGKFGIKVIQNEENLAQGTRKPGIFGPRAPQTKQLWLQSTPKPGKFELKYPQMWKIRPQSNPKLGKLSPKYPKTW